MIFISILNASYDKALQFHPKYISCVLKGKVNLLKKLNRVDEVLELLFLNNYILVTTNFCNLILKN